jgi:hypothetical protein
LPLVNQVGYLRSLITLACLWIPLIWIDCISRNHIGAWLARLGYGILFIAWAVKLIGRLEDAGKPLRFKHGLLLISFILVAGILSRIQLSHWLGRLLTPDLFAATLLVPKWLEKLTGYNRLVLFLIAQTPFVVLRSKPGVGKLMLDNYPAKRAGKRLVRAEKTNVLALCGPFEFLRIVVVLAGLCVPLVYVDYTSGDGLGRWLARVGYSVLAFFWMTFAHGRLKDAGWAHSEYPSQYFLVVSVASLMPLAVHWVNGYEALAIFVALQVPSVFLPTKPLSETDSEKDPGASNDPRSELQAGGRS